MNMYRNSGAIIGSGKHDMSQYNFIKIAFVQKEKEYRFVPQKAETEEVFNV